MKKFNKFFFISSLTILCTYNAKSQIVIEAEGGVGYTIMNMKDWAGREPEEWNKLNTQFNFQLLYKKSHHGIGLNYGYAYLFWYDVEVPYGYYTSINTSEIDAQRVMAFYRYSAKNLFYDFGIGVYLFEEFTDFATSTSVGYMIPITQQLTVPVKLNWAIVFDEDATLMPVSLSAGLSFSINKRK